MTKSIKRGLLFALITAAISGFSIFYNKLVLVGGIDPLVFNIIKNGGVAFVLSLFILMNRKITKLGKLTRRQWVRLAAIGVIGGSIPFVLFFEGLRSVPAVNAAIIHKTIFLWVALLALPLLGERLSTGQMIGYLIVAWSNVLIGGFTGFSFGRGEALILGATVLWSFENIIAKVALKDTESMIVAWGRMAIGSVLLVVIAVAEGKIALLFRVTPQQWLVTAGSVLLLTGYVSAWYRALAFASATLVASVLIIATPITNVLSALFITHALPAPQVVNLAGTLGGLFLISAFLRFPNRKPTVQPS